MPDLETAIIKTLAWFDIFDYPLTEEELYRYLWSYGATDNPDQRMPSMMYGEFVQQLEMLPHYSSVISTEASTPQRGSEVEKSVEVSVLPHDSASKSLHPHFDRSLDSAPPFAKGGAPLGMTKRNGLYFLPGREHIIAERERKIPLLEKKMRIARRAVKKLRWLPFVRAVFIGNTVAQGTAEAESDIDVFIIVKSGRLFLTRLLVTILLTLTRYRRTGTKIQNHICLCFYVTDGALNLAPIRIASPDIYLAYWLVQLIPLYDPDNLYSKIQHENDWLSNYLLSRPLTFTLSHRFRVEDLRLSKLCKRFFETAWRGAYGDMLEKQAKQIQLAKMKLNTKSAQNTDDSRVIISDKILKFHENDRRAEYRERWKKLCTAYTKEE